MASISVRHCIPPPFLLLFPSSAVNLSYLPVFFPSGHSSFLIHFSLSFMALAGGGCDSCEPAPSIIVGAFYQSVASHLRWLSILSGDLIS